MSNYYVFNLDNFKHSLTFNGSLFDVYSEWEEGKGEFYEVTSDYTSKCINGELEIVPSSH